MISKISGHNKFFEFTSPSCQSSQSYSLSLKLFGEASFFKLYHGIEGEKQMPRGDKCPEKSNRCLASVASMRFSLYNGPSKHLTTRSYVSSDSSLCLVYGVRKWYRVFRPSPSPPQLVPSGMLGVLQRRVSHNHSNIHFTPSSPFWVGLALLRTDLEMMTGSWASSASFSPYSSPHALS